MRESSKELRPVDLHWWRCVRQRLHLSKSTDLQTYRSYSFEFTLIYSFLDNGVPRPPQRRDIISSVFTCLYINIVVKPCDGKSKIGSCNKRMYVMSNIWLGPQHANHKLNERSFVFLGRVEGEDLERSWFIRSQHKIGRLNTLIIVAPNKRRNFSTSLSSCYFRSPGRWYNREGNLILNLKPRVQRIVIQLKGEIHSKRSFH